MPRGDSAHDACMPRLFLCLATVFFLAGCGERAVSTARWAEIGDRIEPDLTSGRMCAIFKAIPMLDDRGGMTWVCADGRFSGVFTPDPRGDPRLLYGRFIPETKPTGSSSPRINEADMDLMRRLQQHWHTPLADLDAALRRLDEIIQSSTDESDRTHGRRLFATAHSAAAWVAGGRPEPMPFSFTYDLPGDLDVAWVVVAITGDIRALRSIVNAATTATRPVLFAARWSLEANLRQDLNLDTLLMSTQWLPAEQHVVERIRARCELPRRAASATTP